MVGYVCINTVSDEAYLCENTASENSFLILEVSMTMKKYSYLHKVEHVS